MQTFDSAEIPLAASTETSKALLCERVFNALENERCLDLQYRHAHAKTLVDANIPNYKVMKQLALRNRFGVLYGAFIALAVVLTPVLSCCEWAGAILMLCRPRRAAPPTSVHMIPTAAGNIPLVEAAMRSVHASDNCAYDSDLMRLSQLAVGVGGGGVFLGIAAHLRLLVRILRLPAGKRGDMLLHSRDAFRLILLAHFTDTHQDHAFATDDHYQRWAYLLSHSAPDFLIAQHGFLDPAIAFAHPFGRVKTICVRDDSFVSQFEKYYSVGKFHVYSPIVVLDQNPFSGKAIFLASSFPSIQVEIDLIKAIKERIDVPVIIKFHPSHSYDDRKQVLSSMASYVCSAAEYPACRAFVSFGSFMEYDYSAVGVKSFSIVREGGVVNTALAITAFLEQA